MIQFMLLLMTFVPLTTSSKNNTPLMDNLSNVTNMNIEDKHFRCTEVIGVSVTADWFSAGFKSAVNSNNWQLRARQHAFLQLWADPKNELWLTNVESPCSSNIQPDRILFAAVNWEYTTVSEWVNSLESVVKNIKNNYFYIKRIELLTMIRGRHNKSCGSPETVVDSIVDEAIQIVVNNHSGLVYAGPLFEATTCDIFVKGGPHFTKKGMKEVAIMYANYYRD